MSTFSVQRVLHCGSRVKCIFIDEAEMGDQNGGGTAAPCGYMYCGLSNGYVQKIRIVS